MTPTLRLGRVAGIEIGINWSWVVVFALIVWTLARGVFPSTNPGLSGPAHVAMAIVAALAFFASLLLHELGHALRARREGMEIDGITLWLFGGVARFRTMFPTAGAEFRVAIAGPLVTLALAVLFFAIAFVPGLPQAVDGTLFWLAYVNASLLVFNLLPALPLDGGRVLRALLWHLKGDFRRATRIAAVVGQGFGYLFVALGLALLIFQGAFSGAWLAFVGWFLIEAAGAEARYVLAQQALGGLRVGDLMTPDPATVTPDLSLGQFMDDVVWRRHTAYPVVENGTPVGLLSISRVAAVPRSEWDRCRVGDCMLDRTQVPLLERNESAIEALADLDARNGQRALVLADGKLIGILSMRDLARAFRDG